MIIAVDATEAAAPDRVGVGRFAFDLLTSLHRYLAAHPAEASQVSFRLYTPYQNHSLPPESPYWKYRYLKKTPLLTWFGLPLALRLDKQAADVVFTPTHYIPRFTAIPRVVSVMDLSYLSYPEMFRYRDLYKLLFWTAYSIRESAHVVTISESSRRAIMSTYHTSGDRITVVYPGLTGALGTKRADSNVKNILQKTGKNYILSVGTIQPRKNYVRLIAAFAEFLKTNKQRFRGLKLVIVGKKGWLYQDIMVAPQKQGIADSVVFLDFVPDTDLPVLYKNALCFALPSLYEGFGLPVLEAMSEGCPVVVSSTSSLPELAGKAGIYVNPESVESITKGLLAAVRERNLMQGRYRVKNGLQRVKEFSWDKAARTTLEILKNAAKEQAVDAGRSV